MSGRPSQIGAAPRTQDGDNSPQTRPDGDAVRVPEGLWNADQVAHFLGVTKWAVYCWTRQGLLPHVRVGPRAVRYEPAAIRRYVKRRTVAPTAV